MKFLLLSITILYPKFADNIAQYLPPITALHLYFFVWAIPFQVYYEIWIKKMTQGQTSLLNWICCLMLITNIVVWSKTKTNLIVYFPSQFRRPQNNTPELPYIPLPIPNVFPILETVILINFRNYVLHSPSNVLPLSLDGAGKRFNLSTFQTADGAVKFEINICRSL